MSKKDNSKFKNLNLKLKHKKNDEMKQKLGEYMQGWQRAQADYQNLQKETQKWKEEFVQYAKVDFIQELLPIYSHYKTALSHIPDEDQDKDWVQGIRHIFKQFQDLFQKLGIKEIETIGREFDHNLHEAMGQEEDIKQLDEIIVKELQPGYMLGEKVIQPAKVIINKLNNIKEFKVEAGASTEGE